MNLRRAGDVEEASALHFSDNSRFSSVRFHQSGSGGLGEPLDHGLSEEPSHQGDDDGNFTTPQAEDIHVGGTESSNRAAQPSTDL